MRPTPDSICAWLDGQRASYRRVLHPPTRTSEESARARHEPLECGAKALVLTFDDAAALFVLSAARRLDNQLVRRLTGARQVRFATRDELLELTGLEPGSVPPFGPPILPLDLYVDTSIDALDRVAFNAASLTESLVMPRAEYMRVAAPLHLVEFSRGPGNA